MSILETTLIYGGIPLAVFLIIAAITLALAHNPVAGKHVEPFELGERWDHEPVLWSAVDEQIHYVDHGHESVGSVIGGSASGRW